MYMQTNYEWGLLDMFVSNNTINKSQTQNIIVIYYALLGKEFNYRHTTQNNLLKYSYIPRSALH